jgi:hypothetical protein
VRRPLLVLTVLALSAVAAAAAAPTAVRWSGSASCTITVTGPGYHHSETQRWQVSGAPRVTGSFIFVPSHWTDTGSGSSTVTQGTQTRDITWTVNAAAAGRFKFVVRASDHKLLIGQANAQLRVAGGITGEQKMTVAGVDQQPVPISLEGFETQLPTTVVARTRVRVSGSMPATVVHGSYGPYQPAAATATKQCSWRFVKAG